MGCLNFHFLLRSTNSMWVIIDLPIFKSQPTLFLLRLFESADPINISQCQKFFERITFTLRVFVAGNISLLSTHLSIVTGNLFLFLFLSLHSNSKLSFGLQKNSSSGLPLAPFHFEEQNTILLDALSLTPYFKITSIPTLW